MFSHYKVPFKYFIKRVSTIPKIIPIINNHQITSGFTFDQSTVSYHATETGNCEVNTVRKVICDDESETEDSAKVSGKSKTYSLFTSDTATISDGIFVTGSLRYNHTKVENTLSTLSGNDRPGIVHRIDKETSGLLVVAKDNISHQKLSDQFVKHSISRKYIALAVPFLQSS